MKQEPMSKNFEVNSGWKVKVFEWGRFALDGGAMFGVVPKTLWSKLTEADESNRIPLALRSLYLEKGDMKVLIDLGMGFDWEDKYKKIYKLESSPVGEILKRELNLQAKDITHILLTHLHFDHCGFLSVKEGNEWKSTFENAEIFLLEENFLNAKNPSSRESASYLSHFWSDPLKRGQFTFIDCEWLELREVLPGLHFRRVDGHTRGQGIVYGEGLEKNFIFLGDLCPTENHLKESYVMGYDLDPARSVLEKRQVFSESETSLRTLYFEHSDKKASQ